MRWLKNASLTVTLISLFVACWGAHSVSGWYALNREHASHERAPISYAAYLKSPEFLESTFENWESEFLQMAVFVFLSAKLVQKGAAESRKPEGEREAGDESRVQPSSPWPVRKGGLVARLYSHSLSITFALLFIATWSLHLVSGASAYSEELREHGKAPVSLIGYVSEPQFWFESLQNWQSEFLATASLVVLSIFLREKDSPESKPVTAPHAQTGT